MTYYSRNEPTHADELRKTVENRAGCVEVWKSIIECPDLKVLSVGSSTGADGAVFVYLFLDQKMQAQVVLDIGLQGLGR